MAEYTKSFTVAHLAEEGLAPRTIKAYLSAIRHLKVSMNRSDPKIGEMPHQEQVLKGRKREFAKKNPDKRERLPITPELLLRMKQVWTKDPKKFENVMLWAACCVCYFGFLRSGEVTVPLEASYDNSVHLDIAIDNAESPSTVKIRIKASKTDQFRKRVDVYLGHTHNPLCPVEALLAYIVNRGKEQDMLFRFEDGQLLTKERFVVRVREALSQAGVNAKLYSGHSFRIGAATMAG